MKNTSENSAPSAPPLNESESNQLSIPIAKVTCESEPIVASAVPFSTSTQPERVSVLSKSITTTYSDGRQETVTEYSHPQSDRVVSPTETISSSHTASVSTSPFFPPETNLGDRKVVFTCPYCSHNDWTKTRRVCGKGSWIKCGILTVFFFPLFWVPLLCPSCKDTKHYCKNCGRVVGKSKSECCT